MPRAGGGLRIVADSARSLRRCRVVHSVTTRIDLRPGNWIALELEFSVWAFPGWEERSTMKASKFSDAQKAFILKQGADGVPVADICRKAGISQATYFNWKKKSDGLLPRRCGG